MFILYIIYFNCIKMFYLGGKCMKKRHIILTTNPDDPTVIYGDACKDNTVI